MPLKAVFKTCNCKGIKNKRPNQKFYLNKLLFPCFHDFCSDYCILLLKKEFFLMGDSLCSCFVHSTC